MKQNQTHKHTHRITYSRGVSELVISGKHAWTILPSPEHAVQTLCVTEGRRKLIALNWNQQSCVCPSFIPATTLHWIHSTVKGKLCGPTHHTEAAVLPLNKTYDNNFPYSCTCFFIKCCCYSDTHHWHSKNPKSAPLSRYKKYQIWNTIHDQSPDYCDKNQNYHMAPSYIYAKDCLTQHTNFQVPCINQKH